VNDWEATLAASLKQRWKTYRKTLKDCQRDFSEKAVHDSRIQTRRLLSLIELLAVFLAESHLKRARRALKRHLDAFDPLRDTQVQLLLLEEHRRQFPRARPFHDALARREKRCLKEAARAVRRVKVHRVEKVVRSLVRQLKNLRNGSAHRSRHRLAVLHAVEAAFALAVELKGKMDPGMAETIHRTRIAFKRFRYMVEALQPILPDITPDRLEAMQDFQSMMGEVQDTEMFLAQLDCFIRGEPRLARSLAHFRHWLLRRRTSQITFCLKHADRLHRFWPLERGPRVHAADHPRASQ
jgi:CHAD domain-containing protein